MYWQSQKKSREGTNKENALQEIKCDDTIWLEFYAELEKKVEGDPKKKILHKKLKPIPPYLYTINFTIKAS